MARKTAKPRSSASTKRVASGTPEPLSGALSGNQHRLAYALSVLTEEIKGVYPDLPVTPDDYNGWGVALSVSVDTTVLGDEDRSRLITVLDILGADARVAEVINEDGQTYVRVHADPMRQDNRAPFGVAGALTVLDDSEDEQSPEPVAEGGDDD